MKNRISSFIPNVINTQESPDGEQIGLQFGKDDDFVEVIFPKTALPQLFGSILSQLRLTLPAAIRPEQMDGIVTPQGHDVLRLPDGRIELNIHLRTDDGMRTMSWSMSPADALELAEKLRRHAS
jgi:hypothetical protein